MQASALNKLFRTFSKWAQRQHQFIRERTHLFRIYNHPRLKHKD